MLHARVTGWHTQELVIATRLIGHAEHADGAASDDDAGEGRLLEEDERVEGVSIKAQRVVDESVVVRISRRGEEHSIKANAPCCVIHLVFITTA